MHVPPDPALMGRLKLGDLLKAAEYFAPREEA